MYHYVTDKEYLRQSYGICADIVNQLVQNLKKEKIEAKMATVGSKKRGLITQNEKEPIDYDFNLIVSDAERYAFCIAQLKQTIMKSFNMVLKSNGWSDCKDSTSVITAAAPNQKKGNKTPFSIDICIVKVDSLGLHRLIHRKTGCAATDQYYWNLAGDPSELDRKEKYLKPNYWTMVRDTYLDKKNMYLERRDYDHPSFICYIEALNEVYEKVSHAEHWSTLPHMKTNCSALMYSSSFCQPLQFGWSSQVHVSPAALPGFQSETLKYLGNPRRTYEGNQWLTSIRNKRGKIT